MARMEDMSIIIMLGCGDVGFLQEAGTTVPPVKRMDSMLESLGTSIVSMLRR
jgi:hypothetical protein